MSNNTSDNIEKTVIAGADKTVVARPDGDKTIVAKAAADKTVVATAASKTLAAQAADKTLRPSGETAAVKKEIADLSKNYEPQYLLNGVTYKTNKLISATSGEARIFLVENKGKQYVLKLYNYG